FGEAVLPLEDQIAQVARKHLPGLLQTLGALPDRLRLLGLPGEERAHDLKAELTELLKGDASEAAPRLGAAENTIAAEIQWARQATRALDEQGEGDIRQARAVLAALHELEQIFPGEGSRLAPAGAVEQIKNALEAQAFYEQLPDLRSGLHTVLHNCQERYKEDWGAYKMELETALDELEAQPAWARLLDTDRQELARRLALTLPEQAEPANPLGAYKTLLVRRRSLPGLLNELEAEVERRAPSEPGDGTDIEEITFAELLPDELLASPEELSAWLEWLKDYLVPRLEEHKRIRIRR
ncbi:MAG TPA: hypothetical protein PKG95_08430, partial [Anaerolineaceae bacterium]|nr:hypothetical protein [Anaerolineaceae bacterium]